MASNEQTPLIIAPTFRRTRQPRSSSSIAKRFCSIAIGSSLLALIFLGFLPALFHGGDSNHAPPSHGHHGHPTRPSHPNGSLTNEQLEALLLDWPSTEKLSEWSRYYTAGPHLAGANISQAIWTMEKWQEFGITHTNIAPYDVYLNYPLGHRLALYENSSNSSESHHDEGDWKVKFEASLEEDVLEEDPTTGAVNRIPTFHGYSATGNVTAQYVYVNYGTYQDFEDLIKANVSLKGNIAIAKYGGIFRGLKVKRAQELGMVGTIIYTDPGDDHAPLHDASAEYPDGPFRNPSSVQRGSTQFLSIAPGDPTTVGRPSLPGVPRDDPALSIPSIPSIPISYADAIPILKALNGHGPTPKDLNKYWERNLGLLGQGVNYNVGPSPADLVLNLVNEQDYKITPIWNVIGVINGTLPDEVIVVGNHRDAWIVGGAGDPNSGSAALMEVVRGFGHAVKQGWKPLRTIVFASWDGEEYGLIGSTEWVEEYLPWLSAATVSYVNIDVGCSGPEFIAAASPLLNNLIYEVTGMVQSPNQTVKGQTVRDIWSGDIYTMGSGSDFTAFQDYAGIPSLDFGFTASADSPVYHYHSNYDSYYWMETYGDPGWHYHAAAAKVLGLLIAKLSQAPLVPLNTSDYGRALKQYIKQLEDKLDVKQEDSETLRFRPAVDVSSSSSDNLASLHPFLEDLQDSASAFLERAESFDSFVAELKERAGGDIPWWKWWSRLKLYIQIRKANWQLKMLERQFLYEEGLDGRNWFKHVIFAPGIWTGYSGGK